jgi:LacI family transcriptional regulator
MAAADDAGQIVTLGSTGRRAGREADYVAAHRGQRSRAVILAGSRTTDRRETDRLETEVAAFHEAGGRVVAISQPKLDVDTVVVQNRAAARELALELVRLGYRDFAVLGGPVGLLTSKDRIDGFRSGLRTAEVPAPSIVRDDFTRDGGYAAMSRVIDSGDVPQCVFAVNDVMAVGAMAACRDHGLRLPGDVAMAGFDDIATLRDISPGLTTVRLPLERLGREAVELVLSEAGDTRTRSFEGEVVLRDSTPRLR